MLALDYALRYPDSLAALILVVTCPGMAGLQEARQAVAKLPPGKTKRRALELLYGRIKDTRHVAEILGTLWPLYWRNPPSAGANVLGAQKINPAILAWWFSAAWPKFDLTERLKDVRCPTLIIGGRRDWICPVSQSVMMHENIPASKLVVFPEGRHMLFHEENERFIREIRTFWSGTARSGSGTAAGRERLN
jgi:proline iminopeptidase